MSEQTTFEQKQAKLFEKFTREFLKHVNRPDSGNYDYKLTIELYLVAMFLLLKRLYGENLSDAAVLTLIGMRIDLLNSSGQFKAGNVVTEAWAGLTELINSQGAGGIAESYEDSQVQDTISAITRSEEY